MNTKLKIKLIHADAIIPKYTHPGDSGMDLYAVEDVLLYAGDVKPIKTGLQIAIPEGYEGQIRPKSGLALNHHITVLNTPGTIDSGYRGELVVILINHSKLNPYIDLNPYVVKKGEKVAQLVIAPVVQAEIEVVDVLDETPRGAGGFGSTGVL